VSTSGPGERAHVIYVHGLWMPGEESLILRRRLAREFALTLHSFRYSATSSTMSAITANLASFVRALDAPVVHLVGHSLGGLVIYRFLERFPEQPDGRVVFLGTPCMASRAAERAGRFAPVAHLMGPSAEEELLRPCPRRWTHARALGIIAGRQPLGVGQLLAHFEGENDGTVAVSETRMPGSTDHIVLPVSHLGMLLSARVARETGVFLTQGRFSLR
jgi:pimeloyl-ACP methyl ester carboxylesterase